MAFYANENGRITISAKDELSGVDTINYYVSEELFTSIADLNNVMSVEQRAWRIYSKGDSIIVKVDRNNYIYARITDNAGNETYISTGKIICDTVAPVVKSIVLSSPRSGSGTLVLLVGKDEESGVDRFKLICRETSKDPEPSKKFIQDNGVLITVSEEDGSNYGGMYTFDNLAADKEYDFFAIAIDKAGNVSSVRSLTGNGKSGAAGDVSGNDAKDSGAGSGGAGLTPAPNGIAGSGPASGQGGGSGAAGTVYGNSAGSITFEEPLTGSTAATEPLSREISRTPYISDATGSTKIGIAATGGWDRITGEISKADYDSTIEIEMSGLSNIPYKVFETMRDKKILVKFKMPENVIWSVDSQTLFEEDFTDRDLGVKVGSKAIPDKVLNDVTDTNPHFEFDVNYDGDFGFKAGLSFPVGSAYAGLFANLYHYDKDGGELKLLASDTVSSEGVATFELDHASSYTIVLTSIPLMQAQEEIQISKKQSITDDDALETEDISLRMPDLFGLKGRVRVYLFIIAAISAALCVAILFLPELQEKLTQEDDDSAFKGLL